MSADDIYFAKTDEILERLYETFQDVTSPTGGEINPKLLDDAANEIEWLRSIVAAILNGPLSGDSTERRSCFPDERWNEVHDALDAYERSHHD